MSDIQGLRIVVSADVQAALRNLTQLSDATAELALEGVGNIEAVNIALKDLRDAQKNVGTGAELQVVNRAIKDLSIEARDLKRAGTEGFDEFGKKAEQAGKGVTGFANSAFSSIRKIAYILPGIGIAGIFGLIGTGLVAAGEALGLFSGNLFKTSDATKRAEEDAKHLAKVLLDLKSASDVTEGATGSEAGNIERVRALAAAIQDTNKTYKERKNALDQLRETNKAYFGDLTLESASLKTLSGRVSEYTKALITEAIVKGQVEEIAKVSSELEKQVKVLDKLKDARDRALAEKNAPQASFGGGGTGSVGGNNISEQTRLSSAVSRTEKDFEKQRDAVLSLRTAVASYTGELDKNISLQIEQKPLKAIQAQKDELKSLIPILEQIKKIREDLAKPDKRPLHERLSDSIDQNDIKLIQTQIAEAIQKGIRDPKNKGAYEDLVKALNDKLTKLRNPDLHSTVDIGIQDVKLDDIDKEESKIEKVFGKEIKLKVPADVSLDLKEGSLNSQRRNILLHQAEEDALNNLPTIRWNPKIQVLVDQKNIEKGLQKQLGMALNKAFENVAKSGFSSLGESIGTAIGSGTSFIQAAGHSILTSIGDLISQIGKALIEYGTVKEGLDAILSGGIAIPGVAAIALGVAAVAIGALVKEAFKPKAFATGGIVTGPTMGLVGEAGPEVIFPLSQLNRFIGQNTQGQGAQTVRVVGQISGRNLNLIAARDTKNQRLV